MTSARSRTLIALCPLATALRPCGVQLKHAIGRASRMLPRARRSVAILSSSPTLCRDAFRLPFEGAPKMCALKYVLAYPWGAPSCRSRLSLPALLAVRSPLPAPQSPSLSLSPAIVGRPNALTLCPWCALAKNAASYSVAALLARTRNASSLRRASFAFHAPRGSRSRWSRSPRLAGNPRAPCGRLCRAVVAVGLAMREALPRRMRQ